MLQGHLPSSWFLIATITRLSVTIKGTSRRGS